MKGQPLVRRSASQKGLCSRWSPPQVEHLPPMPGQDGRLHFHINQAASNQYIPSSCMRLTLKQHMTMRSDAVRSLAYQPDGVGRKYKAGETADAGTWTLSAWTSRATKGMSLSLSSWPMIWPTLPKPAMMTWSRISLLAPSSGCIACRRHRFCFHQAAEGIAPSLTLASR